MQGQVTVTPVTRLIGWLPLAMLTAAVFGLRTTLIPWAFMWSLAVAIFAGLKWATWWNVPGRRAPWRSLAYLLAWPGMDAQSFLDSALRVPQPTLRNWFWPVSQTALGATLLWVVARTLPGAHPLWRG